MEEDPSHDAVSEPEAAPTRCRHRLAPGESWPWLPTASHGHLARHPWCAACGSVAAMGGDRALDMGGLMNELARLFRALTLAGVKVTEAQRRLMGKRLAEIDAHDRFTLTRDAQAHVVLGVVSHYTGIHADTLATYARAV